MTEYEIRNKLYIQREKTILAIKHSKEHLEKRLREFDLNHKYTVDIVNATAEQLKQHTQTLYTINSLIDIIESE